MIEDKLKEKLSSFSNYHEIEYQTGNVFIISQDENLTKITEHYINICAEADLPVYLIEDDSISTEEYDRTMKELALHYGIY